MAAVRLTLSASEYQLVVEPQRGGSIAAFSWRGEPILRPTCGPSILDTSCFPLVPFSNRIAAGRFRFADTDVCLTPNLPGSDHPHPLHGFGWLAQWAVVEAGSDRATIEHRHAPGEWPWRYTARQTFVLSDAGMEMTLSVRNEDTHPMPAGLGFHPYFPRDEKTFYHGLHRGEWQTTSDCLPEHLDERAEAIDWWNRQPAGHRKVDTVYTDRSGPLRIDWPARNLAVVLRPSDNLPFTVVYTPPGEPFLCVEPVSHPTDAVNRPEMPGMTVLETGASLCVSLAMTACSNR